MQNYRKIVGDYSANMLLQYWPGKAARGRDQYTDSFSSADWSIVVTWYLPSVP